MLSVPPKGKVKEQTHWRAGWWDFYPFVEPKRPIQWSHSSVIFTAHASQPLVVARHISSSKQFILPSPSPILDSPLSYDPPIIILVAPGDDWLFAYFPRQDGDGTGCLWIRAARIDNWQIKECWNFPNGGGIVAGRWLSKQRDWIPGPSGLPIRMPPLGPKTPITHHCLLLVTQDYQVQLCYLRLYAPSVTFIKCSLKYPGIATENQPSNTERSEGSKASRLCVDAAVGLNYNESSVLIAMHSHCIPSLSAVPSHVEAMGHGVQDESTRHPNADLCNDWETWGEESSIELCEVQIEFNGTTMALATRPLSPPDQSDGKLSSLTFVAAPSEGAEEKGKLYLAATYLDFEDLTTTPTSQLVVFSLNRRPLSSGMDLSWACSRECARSFKQGVLAFVQPLTTANRSLIFAAVLDCSGTRKGSKQTAVGTIKVLNILDLTENEDWEQVPIRSPPEQIGREVPLSATISPNCKLLCTLSSSLWHSQIAIHALPKCRSTSGLTSDNPQFSLGLDLASAILGRRTVDDIVHMVSLQVLPIDEVVDVLNHALEVLDESNVSPRSTTWDILGAATGIYRSRAITVQNDAERNILNARWQAAHDMCSIAACNIAFEDCREGEAYDLDAVWQLIGLCRWVVEFFEKLMKECVLYSNLTHEDGGGASNSHPQTTNQTYPPILLNLAHPQATWNLFTILQHLKRFRTYLGSLSAGGENSRIARDALVDLVDCSGVDFEALYPVLEEIVQKSKTHDNRVCRKALASLQPPMTMCPQLAEAVQMLTQSSILNKSTLFINPFDLVDGITRLSVHNQRKGKDKDVVTKSTLSIHTSSVACLRCSGKSNLGSKSLSQEKSSFSWRTWENMWVSRCICGGLWTSSGL
ncbi:hypothetical protein K443DRAFT_672780 [Laccaria amethystina LaAM-08-1]|uniref:Mediator complex subunit 16 C-terminal domain-containing protein n=1 Tax=Laccaria amethystina LaAM-08-1 TaxID=1095629 RepID=A0A0C9XTL0_9AGAR|nr:hypothetical protein K443DRAFT_672780 [Laccaria amethystina LaAM-08-1]